MAPDVGSINHPLGDGPLNPLNVINAVDRSVLDWCTDAAGHDSLTVIAPFQTGDARFTWEVFLEFKMGQLELLSVKFIGWLAHAMFCVTGVPGRFSRAMEGSSPRWMPVENDYPVDRNPACYRYETPLDRKFAARPC